MKKKVLSLFLALLLVFLSMPLNLLAVAAESYDSGENDSSDGLPVISIVSIHEHVTTNPNEKNYASPRGDLGEAYFRIRTLDKLTEPVTVHYATEDRSAIASAGDYEATSGSVTLTPDNPEVIVSVKTPKTEYAIDVHVHNGHRYYSYLSLTFVIKITGIEGNAVIDEKNKEVECALQAEHNLVAYQYDGVMVMSPYTYNENYKYSNILKSDPCDEGETWSKKYTVNFPVSWKNDYADSGIDAKLYMSIQDAHIDESWNNDTASAVINIGPVTIDLNGEFYNTQYGIGLNYLYRLYGVSGSGGQFKDYCDGRHYHTVWKTIDNESCHIGYSETPNILNDMESNLAKKYVIRRRLDYFGEPAKNSQNPGEFFMGLSDEMLSKKELEIKLYSYGGYDRVLKGGSILFRLEDVIAPQIEKNSDGSYVIYHNLDTAKKGEKIRVSIRFNEPVQITGKTPYIMGKVNGIGTGVEPNPYAIRFNYVGGSGTDTLCFESDYQGEYQITSITDLQFKNSDSIKDFGGVANSFSTPANLTISGFNLDNRKPVISVAAEDEKTSEWAKSKSISVTVSNISDTATLYYSWTDSADAPKEYESMMALNNISVNGTQKVTITGDGDGIKYLHLKAVSKYGKETKNIILDSNSPQTVQHLGPYYFDNTAPTIDEAGLLPKSEGSDMSTKKYVCPIPTDNGSGFYMLRMYYVDENGTDQLIKEIDTVGSATEIKLKAEEVDVGPNTRREVTIFFTLEDNLGNIDGDVARHTVLFDTYTYMEIESAGSAPDFNDNTEKLDDYTLIYSGDVENDDDKDGFAYKFYISVPSDVWKDHPYTKGIVKRNGIVLDSDDYKLDVYEEMSDSGKATHTFNINFYAPMESGYYDIYLASENGESTLVSRTYRIYVGSGKGSLGEKIDNGTVLINKVYQLPSYSYFYYMDTSGTLGAVNRETYNGTALAASFSSESKAFEYVRFNEYRDLYAVPLNAELADALNEGTAGVQKALGEETIAREGQIWIRYKSASWDVSKTPKENDWVFYYYGSPEKPDDSSEKLNGSKFSPLLTAAIDSIAQRITDKGKTVALTDFSLLSGSGATHLDRLGAPYLDPLQMHTATKRLVDEIIINSDFETDYTYTADSSIYSSSVIINNVEYYLVGNVVIPGGSRFQYKRIDENGTEDKNWKEIEFSDGQRFRDVLKNSSRYRLRELGSDGVSEFKIYLDGSAPMLLVSWIDKDGETHSQMLNQSSEKEFRARSLRIVGIDSREYDKYSYVAFYSISDAKLYVVYTLSELQRSPVDIPDGNYYMVIADRSGNSFTIRAYINSSKLNSEVKVSENVKIRFTCDRKESQIQEFYVKRGGILISGKYASELEFTESGIYEFYVRDIYGNVFSEIHEFNRVYPEVSWKYRNESGHYVAYDPENKTKYFNLESYSEGSYTMSTSVDLKFHISGEYGFTFVGEAPEYFENINDSSVTLKTTQAFQLKVYYKKHPDVYTVYNCYADTTAPIIEASVEVNTPLPDEIEELRQAIASGAIVNDGSKLIPSKISYSSSDVQIKYLKNNDTVLSDFIKVNVNDESGLASVRVYLNGELITEHVGEGAVSDIILSKAGEYRIVAEDILGNKAEFTFTNGIQDSFSYLVDGLPYKTGLNDFEKFDENGVYTDCDYGNESVVYVISEQMKVFYMISDSNGAKHFVAFDIRDKAVYEVYYCLDSDNNLILATSDKPLFNGNDPKTNPNTEQVVYEIKEMGVKIYGLINVNGDVVLTVYANDQSTLTVEARLNTDHKECYYTKTELSSASADLIIKTTEGLTSIEKTNELIKLNCPFSISSAKFEEDKISYASVYYSKVNDFFENVYFDWDDIYAKGKTFEDEGFYLIILVNEYGNESIFLIHVSYRFDVTSYSEFSDGQKIHYSASYENTLYSNNKVVFEVYFDGVTIKVKKDGADYLPVVNIENGITSVILSEEGNYDVSFSDAHGNNIKRSAEINKSTAAFNENLLIGYNENALKKKEGYTNQKLSVNKAVFDEEMISYLAVEYGDEFELIFDSISESGVELDESRLTELIGNKGDGEYVLIARDRYGRVLTKTVHYRGTPTLTLKREIRSSTEPEIYDLSKAISIGFWSNSELLFETDAENYIFTVNGDKTECPKKLAFTSAEQYGRSEYVITYVDEYGFSYSFKAYLVRQELEIKPDLSKVGQDIDGVLTTTEDIAVLFSENATCVYTLNNSEERIYTPGEKLSQDGVYRFFVVDYAGNMSALTLKKDTIVEFTFVENNSLAVIQSGEVINSSKVTFQTVNGDSAFIEKAYRNGVAQSNIDGAKFGEDGKWEFIVSDKLGNKSYFCFYIVTKQKASFAYTTPYEYFVTELWYDSGDGIKISYLKFVNHSETSSSFEFVENGTYTVVMTSSVTGSVSEFEFKINTQAPKVSLVGCNVGETTINDVTVTGCVVGDTIRIYRATKTGEELVKEVVVTSQTMTMPTINEGGEYRIVVVSEAGVATELNFVRKHVMNTAGSVFIIIVISVAVVGLFAGLVYRNKSKTDK